MFRGWGSGPKRVGEPNSLSLLFDVPRRGFFISAVAKRKSLFDDKAVEIEELTYIIKQVSDERSGEPRFPVRSLRSFSIAMEPRASFWS